MHTQRADDVNTNERDGLSAIYIIVKDLEIKFAYMKATKHLGNI